MQDTLRTFCEKHTGKTFWVALSGGLDSYVLLYLLHALRTELSLDVRAIHVNHGLSPYARQWADHCRQICENLNVVYLEHELHLALKAGESLENIARQQRYHLFSQHLDEQSILVTAHHQDDQAETFLLQLCRGAGVKGLSAMPSIKSFGKGLHARPLLSFTRARLEVFAQANQLVWIEDESNKNEKFSRNFIRHQILPPLQTRWPAISAAIARSAAHCAENQTILDELANDLTRQSQGSRPGTLSVKKLLSHSSAKQKMILRYWIQAGNYPLPDTQKLLTIQRNVLTAATDKLPFVQWCHVELSRYRDDLYLRQQACFLPPSSALAWDLAQPLKLPHGLLQVQRVKGKGISSHWAEVSVGFRQGGEMIEMPGRGGRHALKKLFQEWQVLPWERDSIPLVSIEGKVIAVVGYFVNEQFAAKFDEWGNDLIFSLA